MNLKFPSVALSALALFRKKEVKQRMKYAGSGDVFELENPRYSHFGEFCHYVKTDIQMLPVRLWPARIWMTLCFLPWYFIFSIKQWRAQTALFKWELWCPDWGETREESLAESRARMKKKGIWYPEWEETWAKPLAESFVRIKDNVNRAQED